MSRRSIPATVMMAALTACVLAGVSSAAPVTRNLTFYANKNDYPPLPGNVNYSACWSYVHSDGREYAVIGVNGVSSTTGGTAIYNVTSPAAPVLVGFIPGPQSIWRETKSYRDWIYVVTEGEGPGFGLQVIRMTNPDSPVLAATYTTNFTHSHTVAVDTTRGILICNGTRSGSGLATGMRILALNNPGIGATPETPVEIAWWPGGAIPVDDTHYVHDSVPIGSRLYCSSIYPGIERVLDFTNPATPSEIAEWTYPGGFSHNAWPDATGNWLYVTDEIKGETLKVFDISNLASPVLENAITSNPQAIVHNAHVRGSELYLSNYTEGIRVLDLSDPGHPAEFAWGDSYAGPSGGFCGVWEVAPMFPSGTVVASDRNTGLYVYRVVHDYGIIRVNVVNGGAVATAHTCGPECSCAPNTCTCGTRAATGGPFPGVQVRVTTLGDSLVTPADGIVQFAPGPGTHTVLAHKFGYYDASATRTVSVGSRDTVTLALAPRPAVQFSGTLRDANTSAPLDDAEVLLAYTGIDQHTGSSGFYSLPVPDDMYRLELRRAGYAPVVIERRIGPGFPGQDYSLLPAPVWDPLEAVSNWTIGAAGDNAFSGLWTRTVPQGTGPRPPVTPPPGPGLLGGISRSAQPGPAGPGTVEGVAEAQPAGAGGVWFEGPGAAIAARTPDEAVPVIRRGGGVTPQCAHHLGMELAVLPNMAPYFDHTPGTGTQCFVTGNSADSVNIDAADVDGGKTSLTSPALNLSGMTQPTIGYWRWFASYFPTGIAIGHNGPDPDDYLAVLISNDNGATWTAVDTTSGLENHWEEQTIAVASYLTPTSQVKLRFVAVDGGANTTCEAGIDDLVAYDAALGPVGVPPPAMTRPLAFRAPAPNPAGGAVQLVLDVATAVDVAVDVIDATGRRVRTLHRGAAQAGPLPLSWDGRDANGREAPAGLYFARAIAGAERALTRFARIR